MERETVPFHADSASGKPSARASGLERHDPPSAGLPGGRRRHVLRAGHEMLEHGTFSFGEDAVSYADIARLLKA